MMRIMIAGPLAVVLVLAAPHGIGVPARADTASDCGRFYLKYDPASQTMKCVSGKRKKATPTVTASQIKNQQVRVQRIINQVQDILTIDDLGAEQQRRIRELITEARQRVQEIRRQTAQLRQEQISFAQEVVSAARQRYQAQVELSRSLEQQQRDLVRQLEARQRQFAQSLQRQSRSVGR